MRLLIVRHGDPDYEHDTLTEKGWREAELLSERLSKLTVKEFYVSPLGRAKDTASLTLQKMNREAKECQWLREFDTKIDRPDSPDRKSIAWDWLPEDWTREGSSSGATCGRRSRPCGRDWLPGITRGTVSVCKRTRTAV